MTRARGAALLALVAAMLWAPQATAAACGDPLACVGRRLQSLALPWMPTSPEVLFARNTYTDTPSRLDVRLHVLVLRAGTGAPARTAQLHAAAPGMQILAYQSLWLRPADPSGETACLPGAGDYPASWYMRGIDGAPQTWHTGTLTDTSQMDFANDGFLQACARHAITIATAMGANGVFLDGVATSLHSAQLPLPCESSTCAGDRAWQNAMTHALRYLAAALHAHGLVLVANISGGNVDFCCGGGESVWRRYVSELDGAMEEAWTAGTDGRPLSAPQVQAGLANAAWDEGAGKGTIVNDDVAGCTTCITYGLAAMLLVANGLTSYDISSGSYGAYAGWGSSDAAALALGPPLGPATQATDGLLMRRFAHGAVAVNDSAAAIADPQFGTMEPHSGAIR